MNDHECPTCGGDGELATSHRFRCYTCGGGGGVSEEVRDKALAAEREMWREFGVRLSASEYRAMGG